MTCWALGLLATVFGLANEVLMTIGAVKFDVAHNCQHAAEAELFQQIKTLPERFWVGLPGKRNQP